jgi:hypothetical protein
VVSQQQRDAARLQATAQKQTPAEAERNAAHNRPRGRGPSMGM